MFYHRQVDFFEAFCVTSSSSCLRCFASLLERSCAHQPNGHRLRLVARAVSHSQSYGRVRSLICMEGRSLISCGRVAEKCAGPLPAGSELYGRMAVIHTCTSPAEPVSFLEAAAAGGPPAEFSTRYFSIAIFDYYLFF